MASAAGAAVLAHTETAPAGPQAVPKQRKVRAGETYHRWTEADRTLLRTRYDGRTATITALAAHFGVSRGAIQTQARNMGLLDAARRNRQRTVFRLDEPTRRLIEAKYDGSPAATDELVRRLRLPRHVVQNYASKHGLCGVSKRRWTADEDEWLEANYGRLSWRAMTRALHRTKEAIEQHAQRQLALRRYDEGYTVASLCQALGYEDTQVKKWIASGMLKGCKRNFETGAWYFTDQDIRDFVGTHPRAIDLRKVDQVWFISLLLGWQEDHAERLEREREREALGMSPLEGDRSVRDIVLWYCEVHPEWSMAETARAAGVAYATAVRWRKWWEQQQQGNEQGSDQRSEGEG